MAIIIISDRAFPGPGKGGKLTVAINVSQDKNALGESAGQKAGRDQYKFGSLQWKLLDAKTWSDVLEEFEKFAVVARIPDMANNNWITIKMYPGNRTAEPIESDVDSLPTLYQNCEVNIVDCGVIEQCNQQHKNTSGPWD